MRPIAEATTEHVTIQSPNLGVYDRVVQSYETHYYLNDEIEDMGVYTDMIHAMYISEPQDVIYIHLNTVGGRLDIGTQIINAMRASAAHIITVLDAKAYSLGALIFLAGKSIIVHDDCLLMFHNYNSGTFGKGNEQIAEVTASIKWYGKILRRICTPFLTNEEVEKIVHGEDIWLDSDEVRKRIKRMQNTTSLAPKKTEPPRNRIIKEFNVLE